MSTPSTSNIPIRFTRLAAFTLFALQGLCFASWASRLTDLKSSFNIEDFLHFGLLVSLIPIGKFLSIPIAGFLIAAKGSKTATIISLGGFILSLCAIGLSSTPYTLSSLLPLLNTNIELYLLGLFFLLFGLFWNMTDLSLNTQAIEIERLYGRSILASFHAGWSISACLGALIGFVMINLGVNVYLHFIYITAFSLVLLAYCSRFLLGTDHSKSSQDTTQEERKYSLWGILKERSMGEILILLGLIWLFALVIENTMFDWSNIYFEETIKAPKSMQVGFLVFMLMMTVGRLLTNLAYRLWSKSTVLVIAGFCIFSGFFISALMIDIIHSLQLKVVVNSAGFMLIGLGISCIVPTIYSIVGEKVTSIPVSTALTIMAAISFVGPLMTNILVGYLAKIWGLQVAYAIIGLFGLGVVAIVCFNKSLRR